MTVYVFVFMYFFDDLCCVFVHYREVRELAGTKNKTLNPARRSSTGDKLPVWRRENSHSDNGWSLVQMVASLIVVQMVPM